MPLIVVLFAISCKHEVSKSIQNCCLSSEDSISIINEVFEATDMYAAGHANLDAKKVAEVYDSSPDFKLVYNGDLVPNWDTVYSFTKDWYSLTLDSVKFLWEERSVIPLTRDKATLFGGFYFRANFKSGELYQARGFMTGLFIKTDGEWKLLEGHESVKDIENE